VLATPALAALFAALTGCGPPAHRAEDYVPPQDAGRAALDAYLQSWLRGETSQQVAGTNPAVMSADTLRNQNRTLTGYSILGPVATEAPLCFAVQLTLGNPAQEVRERYVVVGIDPLWVWRYDDYIMITHWCSSDEKKAAPPKK
jgi:hypothetical protein